MNKRSFTEQGSWIVHSEIETLRLRLTISIRITTIMMKQVQKRFPKRGLKLCKAISPDGALKGRPLIKGDSLPRLNRAGYGRRLTRSLFLTRNGTRGRLLCSAHGRNISLLKCNIFLFPHLPCPPPSLAGTVKHGTAVPTRQTLKY